ncbi:hypothetical protein BKA70DRAFT_1266385 [Coprinopsis sp. MPI-PUGE-AT-0042]|nr:hypothetical protein BKA70DRAFT_1266385 [Coprinopsis sp. MPI-PUGE-AT-0042]
MLEQNYPIHGEQLQIVQQIAVPDEGSKTSNACSPISGLPTELLCKIFMDIMHDSEREGAPATTETSSPLSWAQVSHVSCHWRQTALGHPHLWTRLSTQYCSAWIDAMLERSGNAPLEVRMTYRSMLSAPASSNKVLCASHRLASISFARSRDDRSMSPKLSPLHQLNDLLSVPLPILKTLAITDSFPYFENMSLPSTFLASGAPQLPRLEMQGWAPPQWTSPGFRSLVSLVVRTRQESFSLADVLEGLAGMPGLAEVTLEVDYAGDTSLRSTWRPTVKLPLLRSFRIAFISLWGATRFLEHLAIPSSASLSIRVDQD